MSEENAFRVVFVCTGNRCRSPYAAALLDSLTIDLPVTVTSEGTLDAPGHTVPEDLVDIAAERHLQLTHHRARPIERAREMLRRADALRDKSRHSREEVTDPFGGPRRAYETMADRIDTGVKLIAEKLFGVGSTIRSRR